MKRLVTRSVQSPGKKELFEQILDAMEHAHDQGVVHRDLKPENIMVCDNGEIVYLILESQKICLRAKQTAWGWDHPLRSTGAVFEYKDIDARADIYALGVTLYEMVAGRLPWPKEDQDNIMKTKDQGDFPSASEYTHIFLHLCCVRSTKLRKKAR